MNDSFSFSKTLLINKKVGFGKGIKLRDETDDRNFTAPAVKAEL